MEGRFLKKKTLVYNILEFLSEEMNVQDLPREKQEAIKGAINCLANVFEISREDRYELNKVDLISLVPLSSQGIPDEDIVLAKQYQSLGDDAMDNSDFEEAAAQYSQAVDLDPFNPTHYYKRAGAYSMGTDEHIEEARLNCEHALSLTPECSRAHEMLGIVYLNMGRTYDAVKAFEDAVFFNPHDAFCHQLLNDAHNELFEDMAKAVSTLDPPLDNEPFIVMAREATMSDIDFQAQKGMGLGRRKASTNIKLFDQPGNEGGDGPSPDPS